MDLGLRGKVVVITGASKGIGRSIALAFAAEGADVALCARGEEALLKTADELRAAGIRVHAAPCDVAQAAALDAFLEGARRALGRVDVLVNNASGAGYTDDEEGFRACLDVDLMASVRATWKVAPWMAEAGGGAIIHISSVSGLQVTSAPGYGAAKAALHSHAKNMAVALAPKNIRVNAVAPGSINFPGGFWDRMHRDDPARYDAVVAASPFKRHGRPEEVADAVVYLASARASWISGITVVVDGAQHKGIY